MSSILTNTSAMVALQTLRGINSNLAQTQSEISTGKSIGTAKDNAAVWSIAKTMESDVRGFKAISDSLSLGSSTIAVARQASETVTDLLTQMKGRIVAAQEQNVDREKIQTDIVALRDQITSVVNAAQFNGLNLVDGTQTGSIEVLSSLDRNSSGQVIDRSISVARQSLSVTAGGPTMAPGGDQIAAAPARDALFSIPGADTQDRTVADWTVPANSVEVAASGNLTLTVGQAYDGATYEVTLRGINVTMADGSTTQGNRDFQFVAGENTGVTDVATALVNQMNAFFASATPQNAGGPSYFASVGDAGEIIINNNSTAAMRIGAAVSEGGTFGNPAGSAGLSQLANIDVVNDAASALGMIDDLIDVAVGAAASFGSAQARIETQSQFIQNLTDSLTAGIGSLVDADLEATSARLQALQVQQQLATQSLSIANQQPQNILALFR